MWLYWCWFSVEWSPGYSWGKEMYVSECQGTCIGMYLSTLVVSKENSPIARSELMEAWRSGITIESIWPPERLVLFTSLMQPPCSSHRQLVKLNVNPRHHLDRIHWAVQLNELVIRGTVCETPAANSLWMKLAESEVKSFPAVNIISFALIPCCST